MLPVGPRAADSGSRVIQARRAMPQHRQAQRAYDKGRRGWRRSGEIGRGGGCALRPVRFQQACERPCAGFAHACRQARATGGLGSRRTILPMVGSGCSLRNRSETLPAFAGFVLLGLLPLWFSLSSLMPSVDAFRRHAPVVALSPRDAIGLPLAVLCFALAAMTQLPAPDQAPGNGHRGRATSKRGTGALTVCLGVAIGSVLLTVIAVPLTEFATSAILANRHYVACPSPLNERHPPLRWVLPQGHCP